MCTGSVSQAELAQESKGLESQGLLLPRLSIPRLQMPRVKSFRPSLRKPCMRRPGLVYARLFLADHERGRPQLPGLGSDCAAIPYEKCLCKSKRFCDRRIKTRVCSWRRRLSLSKTSTSLHIDIGYSSGLGHYVDRNSCTRVPTAEHNQLARKVTPMGALRFSIPVH